MATAAHFGGSHHAPAPACPLGPPAAGRGVPAQAWHFLSNFREVVQPKLLRLLELLGTQDVSRSWALAQVRRTAWASRVQRRQ